MPARIATPPIDGVPRFVLWLRGAASLVLRRLPPLCLGARRAVFANLVTEALPGDQPDQHRGHHDGHRQRNGDGDEDIDHRGLPRPRPDMPVSSTSESASAPRPAALEALTSTTPPGCSSARSRARAASASATMAASLSPAEPRAPSMTAPWCMA